MYDNFGLKLRKGEESVTTLLLFCLFYSKQRWNDQKKQKKRNKFQIPNSKIFTNTVEGKPRRRLSEKNTQSKGTEFPSWISLYVEDSVFILPTREGTSKKVNLTLKYLHKFGLQMQTGSEKKESKTEALHTPKKSPQSTIAYIRPIEIYDVPRITFSTHFTYLGSIISSDLSDNADVNNRITKSIKAFGSLRSLIFCNPYIPLKLKNTYICQSP